MKRVKENLLIIITILLMLIINLTNTVYAEPLTRVDGSVRVENVGGSPTYKNSNLIILIEEMKLIVLIFKVVNLYLYFLKKLIFQKLVI